jgi:Cu-Zn family superoxide dismutase
MRRAMIALAVAGALAGCTADPHSGAKATAQLQPTKGNQARGTVTFTQRGNRVLVDVSVSGIPPNREVGFHIHDKGDCSSGDGMSAAGHFNPLGKPHAHFTTTERHAGDLPALRADASGNARLIVEMDVITVTDGPTSIIGRGLIVHADPDDYKTQPTGNAGARIACGVIQRG